MKWLVLAVVLILVAPNIARQFAKDEQQQKPTRRGVLYRAVARFGTRVVFVAFVIALAILAVGAYYVVRYVV